MSRHDGNDPPDASGFWTEADDARRLVATTGHPCPHCGEYRVAP